MVHRLMGLSLMGLGRFGLDGFNGLGSWTKCMFSFAVADVSSLRSAHETLASEKAASA